MHLVRHREVVEELSPGSTRNARPLSCPTPWWTADHRRCPSQTAANGSIPSRSSTCSKPMTSRWCRTFAAADVERGRGARDDLSAQGATVVLKIMSRDIVHKSDVGGVVLNLDHARGGSRGRHRHSGAREEASPEARIEGVIVQAMVVRAKARELILGLADDPTFGTARRVRPRRDRGRDHQRQGACAAAARSATGPRPDRAHARLTAAARLSRCACGEAGRRCHWFWSSWRRWRPIFPEIREFDINPLLADETGVTAVDARVAVGPAAAQICRLRPADFAVRPYPSQMGAARSSSRTAGASSCARSASEDEPLIHAFLASCHAATTFGCVLRAVKDFTHASSRA